MKGLELAAKYYEVCKPELMRAIPELMGYAAAGLVGEGSERFGLDDELSQDHDFSPDFCLWLPDSILKENSNVIRSAFFRLPGEFYGYRCLREHHHGRSGPLGIKAFYNFFTGLSHLPESWEEWIAIPEERLAAAVNGEVFEDNLMEFSAGRKHIQDFYPEDVRLKKISARLMIMAQAGQYNLPRSIRRKDYYAVMQAFAKFAEAALSFVFLLNKKYKPYYKLACRKVRSLPVLGSEKYALLMDYSLDPLNSVEAIEEFCCQCVRALNDFNISGSTDSWLWSQGLEAAKNIRNEKIRARNLLSD